MKLASDILEQLGEIEEDKIKNALNKKLEEFDFDVTVDFVAAEDLSDVLVDFVNGDDAVSVLFSYTDEDGADATILEDSDEDEDEELDVVDLDSLNPKIIKLENGEKAIDLVNLDWLTEDGILDILAESEIEERSVSVVRGGKKVRKKLVRRKRRKRLSSKAKAANRRGARKRKLTKTATNRKRKKSMKIRKRLGVKQNKVKGQKIAGTSDRKR